MLPKFLLPKSHQLHQLPLAGAVAGTFDLVVDKGLLGCRAAEEVDVNGDRSWRALLAEYGRVLRPGHQGIIQNRSLDFKGLNPTVLFLLLLKTYYRCCSCCLSLIIR